MTAKEVMEWGIAIATLSAASLLAVVVTGIAISFVTDLWEDTREWLHRS